MIVEQRDREAGEKLQPIRGSGSGGREPVSSSREGSEGPTGSGGKRTKKRRKVVKRRLSFSGEDDGLPVPEVLTKNTLLR